MAIFKYTLASGDQFTLRAPADTTQGQADAVFYSQVAAGSLVGYLPGQTLSSELSQLTKFQLSRLDRGTAGVDDIVILSAIAGLPSISPTLASSINTALLNPVNAGNIVSLGPDLNAPPIGPLSSPQVQAVQAQIINFVNQPANTITVPGVAGNISLSNTVGNSDAYGRVIGIYGTILTIDRNTTGTNSTVDQLNFYNTIGSNPSATATVSPGGSNGTPVITLTDTLTFYANATPVATATVTSGSVNGILIILTSPNPSIAVGQTVTDSMDLILPASTVTSINGTALTISNPTRTNTYIQVGQFVSDSLRLIPATVTTTISTVSNSGSGVGQFGFDSTQLEQSGYLKPGIGNFITTGNETISGPTELPIGYLANYAVTGVPGTTFSWQSVGGWYKATIDATWCSFMATYAVWTDGFVGPGIDQALLGPQAITTNVYKTNLNFPTTGTYTIKLSTDNNGSIDINGIGTFSYADFHTVGTFTTAIPAGTYTITLSITNTGGPAGIAAQILKPDTTELWNSLEAISNSTNPNGYTNGGPYTFDESGTFSRIPARYGAPGTYRYYGIFSTGHTFNWTNTLTYNGPVGATYTARTPGNFIQVLSAPGVWTGKDGVNSLSDLLDSPLIQNIAQTTLMQNSYDGLTATGIIQPPVKQTVSISNGQVYTQSGLQQISALSLTIGTALSIPGAVQSALSNSPVVALTSSPVIQTSTLANGAVNNLNTGAYAGVGSSYSQVNRAVTASAAALIANGSKFGIGPTAAWAISNLINNPNATLVGTGLSIGSSLLTQNLASGLTSAGVNPVLANQGVRIASGLINQATSTIAQSLNNSLNSLGKSSSYASDLADPSSTFNSISNGSIGNVLDTGVGGVTNYIDSVGTNISSTFNNALADPSSLLTNGLASGAINLVASKLGISPSTLNTINTAVQLGTALSTGGLSILTNPSVLSSVSGLLGGGGVFSSLSSLGSIPGLGSVLGGFGGGGLAGQTIRAAGFNNTVNRAVVDSAVIRILGSSKIPPPIFQYPSKSSQAASTNITQAQNVLSSLQGQATSAISSAVNTASADIGSAVSSFFG